ncbi:hypothetical protein [Jeotgalibaca ciconiae]|nr:hypothetical protein [Jeotgalibaca ciconiae]
MPFYEELLEVTEAIADDDESEKIERLLTQHLAVVKRKITVY